MSRKFSFWFFVAAVIAVGVFFFRIVEPFLFPLLIAAVLTLLFRPLYDQLVQMMRGHQRLAAAAAAGLVLLVFVLPVAVGGILAAQELISLTNSLVEEATPPEPSPAEERLDSIREQLSQEQFAQLRAAIRAGTLPSEALALPEEATVTRQLRDLEQDYDYRELRQAVAEQEAVPYLASFPLLRRFVSTVERHLSPDEMQRFRQSSLALVETAFTGIYNRTSEVIANLIQFAIGFAVMALALYYFFVDGPAIARNLQALLPLDNHDEEIVFEQFESVCRGVVLGTILAAFVQAVLLGLGLAVVGIERVWLLTGLTVLMSLIPFVGAAGVYVPAAIYLAWIGRMGAAGALLAYGALIVSSSDNLVRAYVIHGSSRLHPLAALVSVLGALSLVGLWGVFVGPVVAGIFYAMLQILHQKVRRLDEREASSPGEENTIKSAGDLNQLMAPSRSLTES